MKVLAINGSARKDGNTAILINTVFEELHKAGIETEMVQLSGKIMEPCKACWACGCDFLNHVVHRKHSVFLGENGRGKFAIIPKEAMGGINLLLMEPRSG